MYTSQGEIYASPFATAMTRTSLKEGEEIDYLFALGKYATSYQKLSAKQQQDDFGKFLKHAVTGEVLYSSIMHDVHWSHVLETCFEKDKCNLELMPNSRIKVSRDIHASHDCPALLRLFLPPQVRFFIQLDPLDIFAITPPTSPLQLENPEKMFDFQDMDEDIGNFDLLVEEEDSSLIAFDVSIPPPGLTRCETVGVRNLINKK